MFELLLKVKDVAKEADRDCKFIQLLLKRVEDVRQRFLTFHEAFQSLANAFKRFFSLLIEVLRPKPDRNSDLTAFCLHIFFFLVKERVSSGFLRRFASEYLDTDIQPFEDAMEADLWQLNAPGDDAKKIDFVFAWILENQGDSVSVPASISVPILREKFRSESPLAALQEYTENCREVDENLLYEATRDLIEGSQPRNNSEEQREGIQKAISEFVRLFKPDEVVSPLERVLRRGLDALSTVFCASVRKAKCPTCDDTIKRVC